jgi:hypothetical protein
MSSQDEHPMSFVFLGCDDLKSRLDGHATSTGQQVESYRLAAFYFECLYRSARLETKSPEDQSGQGGGRT